MTGCSLAMGKRTPATRAHGPVDSAPRPGGYRSRGSLFLRCALQSGKCFCSPATPQRRRGRNEHGTPLPFCAVVVLSCQRRTANRRRDGLPVRNDPTRGSFEPDSRMTAYLIRTASRYMTSGATPPARWRINAARVNCGLLETRSWPRALTSPCSHTAHRGFDTDGEFADPTTLV